MIKRLKWWFLHRFHPNHQYHIIRTGLKPGYHDPDKRITSAIFGITKEFFEQMGESLSSKEDIHRELIPLRETYEVFKDATEFWDSHHKFFLGEEDEELGGEDLEQMEEKALLHMQAIIQHLGHMWYP